MIEVCFPPHFHDLALVRPNHLPICTVGAITDTGSPKKQRLPKQTKVAKGRRRVRFATGEHGQILETLCPIEYLPSQCDADLYWSCDDQAIYREKAHQMAGEYRDAFPDTVQGLESAFSSCSNEAISAKELRKDLRAMQKWAASVGRGLERRVTRLIRRDQRQVVRDTVKFYRALVLNGKDGEKVDELLQRFSLQRTTKAREFALLMALSDAHAICDEPSLQVIDSTQHSSLRQLPQWSLHDVL